MAANMWVAGRRSPMPSSVRWARLSPFPYALVYPQDEHERLLIERLREAGVEVERQTELVRLRRRRMASWRNCGARDGAEERRAAYIAGCDGARSTMREALGDRFPGRHL